MQSMLARMAKRKSWLTHSKDCQNRLIATPSSASAALRKGSELEGMRENLHNYAESLRHDHPFHLCLVRAAEQETLVVN